jgi:hypothetical protein
LMDVMSFFMKASMDGKEGAMDATLWSRFVTRGRAKLKGVSRTSMNAPMVERESKVDVMGGR